MNHLAFIGGSGLYDLENLKLIKDHSIETPFGKPSSVIKEFEVSNGQRSFFLSRHGEGHLLPPSKINYQANIYALKSLGVKYICSFSAAGSLEESVRPGDFVLVDQYIDWTKGIRKRSFFNDHFAGHVSMAEPCYRILQNYMAEHLEISQTLHREKCYVCIEGPALSTVAESKMFQKMGAHVIGMTNLPEAHLAKEAGIAYSSVAMISDFDVWKTDIPFDLEALLNTMKSNTEVAKRSIEKLITHFNADELNYQAENLFSIVSNPEMISQPDRELIKFLQQ